MDAILTQAQETLLKRTRNALGRLRDVLNADAVDPAGHVLNHGGRGVRSPADFDSPDSD